MKGTKKDEGNPSTKDKIYKEVQNDGKQEE